MISRFEGKFGIAGCAAVWRFFTIAILSLCVGSNDAAWAKRVALVIGNSDYSYVPALKNPANDASDISDELKRLGFEVMLALDATLNQMTSHVEAFAREAQDAELSLVYFAGHGIEIDGVNYLIPVNAEIRPDETVPLEAFPLDKLMGNLVEVEGVKLVLVDACRDNPFIDHLQSADDTRSVGRGLTRVDPIGGTMASGVMVAYAAREGTVALDGDERNSPYAQAILENLGQPGLEVSKLFRRVRDRVFELTDGRQEPFTYGSLPGEDIYILPAALHPAIEDREAREELMFEAVKEAGTPRAWAHYFDEFPHGEHREEALELEMALFRKNLQSRGSGRNLSGTGSKTIDWLRREAVLLLHLSRAQQLAVQSTLTRLGYDPGSIDGNLGSRSFAALSDFQRDRRLLADGVIDRATLNALGINNNGRKSVSLFPVAATLSNRYSKDTIALIEPDVRVHRLVEVFHGRVINYGFFKGRLYATIRTGHLPWDQVLAKSGSAGGYLATIESPEEEAAVVELFRYDSLFWTERKSNDTYEFPGNDDLEIVGPTFGLHQTDQGSWTWVDGRPVGYSNWMRDYPDRRRPKPYGEFVHRERVQNALPENWQWANWYVSRNSFVVEID